MPRILFAPTLAASLLALALGSLSARAAGPERYVVAAGQEAILERMLTPRTGALAAGWELVGITASAGEVAARYRGRDGRPDVSATLRHASATETPALRSVHFGIGCVPEGSEACLELVEQIRAGEDGFVWKRLRQTPPPRTGDEGEGPSVARPPHPGPRFDPHPSPALIAERAAAWVALLLLALFALSLPFLVRATTRLLAGDGRREAPWVAGLTVAGLAVRLVAPHRLVMVFMGYPLLHDAVRLAPLPKYGSAVPALHHVVFQVLPLDYTSVLLVHSVLGALTIPLAAALLRRTVRIPGAAAVAAGLLAFLPLFVKDHNSESYLVAAVFWLFAGLALLHDALDRDDRLGLVAAAVSLSLAAAARPLMYILVPAAALGSVAGAYGHFRPLRRQWGLCFGLVFVSGLLLLPNALHVLAATGEQVASGALPGWDRVSVLSMLGSVFTDNIVFLPAWVPTLIPLLAVSGVILAPRGRRRALGVLLALALLWWALYFLDMPPISRPRLQSPGILLTTLVASAGAVLVVQAAARRFGRRVTVPAALVLAVGVAAHAGLTVPALWARGNADEEADHFATAVAALPSESVLFVRLGEADAPRWGVHRAYPDHLPLTLQRRDTVLSIGDLLDLDLGPRGRRVFYYEGVRCFAAAREGGGASPLPAGRRHPLCEEMHRRFELRPVAAVATSVPNRYASDFPWYPSDRETLPVGLFELVRAEE